MKKIISIFGSMKTASILLVLYAVGLATATFIESAYDTATAQRIIYHNYAFMALQLLLAVSFVMSAIRYKIWRQRKFGALFFHCGLIVVLAGALVTHLTGFEGYVHVRQGDTTSAMVTKKNEVKQLPFSIRLDEFRLTRYPGSNSPSAYDSFLTIISDGTEKKVQVATNRIFRDKGYRLFQSSYDRDEQGTILTANYDPVGVGITYAGYIMLLIGMILMPLHPQSRIRVLGRALGENAKGAVAAVLLAASILVAAPAHAQYPNNSTIPKDIALQMGQLLVQTEGGRIEPMDTYSNQLLRKIYRSHQFDGLTPVQVVAGFMLNPEFWMDAQIIRQPNEQLQEILGHRGGGRMSLYDLFDANGDYKLADKVLISYEKPANERTKLDKDILKLDEKGDILYMLSHGMMMRLFPLPDDPAHRWYSAGDDLSVYQERDSAFVMGVMRWLAEETHAGMRTGEWGQVSEIIGMIDTYQKSKATVELPSENKVKLEILYNKTRLFFFSAMGYMALGLVMLALVIVGMFRQTKRLRITIGALSWVIILLFLLHTAGILLRWYISGHPPWSNGYESMIQVGWTAALAGILFARKSRMTMALAAFLAGIILFVANLNWMDPAITPLVPVLQSQWLMIHVSLITASYGFFGMCFLLGTLSLCFFAFGNQTKLSPDIRRLRTINEISANIGICLLTAGTFVGAIWANESWGRYWGWDPKETWALITMIVYALMLHSRFIPKLASDYAFSVMSVFALGSVLMTYFGVNYYLTGLHSYGGGDTPPAINTIFVAYGVLTALALVAGLRHRGRR